MKRLLKTLFLSFGFTLLFSACEKNDDNQVNCIKEQLTEYNMVPYIGQELGCRFFLNLYELDDKQYFSLGSHCADIITWFVDCEGNTVCENETGIDCEYFYKNAEWIRIAGVQ